MQTARQCVNAIFRYISEPNEEGHVESVPKTAALRFLFFCGGGGGEGGGVAISVFLTFLGKDHLYFFELDNISL